MMYEDSGKHAQRLEVMTQANDVEKPGRLTRCADRFGGQTHFLATLLKRLEVTADRLAGSPPSPIEKQVQVPRDGSPCIASQMERTHEDFAQLLSRMDETAKRLESL